MKNYTYFPIFMRASYKSFFLKKLRQRAIMHLMYKEERNIEAFESQINKLNGQLGSLTKSMIDDLNVKVIESKNLIFFLQRELDLNGRPIVIDGKMIIPPLEVRFKISTLLHKSVINEYPIIIK